MEEQNHTTDLISFEDASSAVKRPQSIYSPNRPLSAVIEEPPSARSSHAVQSPMLRQTASHSSATPENPFHTPPDSARLFESNQFGELETSPEPNDEKQQRRKARSIVIIYRRCPPLLWAIIGCLLVLVITMAALLGHYSVSKSKHSSLPSESALTTTNAPATSTHEHDAMSTKTEVHTRTTFNTDPVKTQVVTTVTHTSALSGTTDTFVSTVTRQVTSTPTWTTSTSYLTSMSTEEASTLAASTTSVSTVSGTTTTVTSTMPLTPINVSALVDPSSTAVAPVATSPPASSFATPSSFADDAVAPEMGVHGLDGSFKPYVASQATSQDKNTGQRGCGSKATNSTIAPVGHRRVSISSSATTTLHKPTPEFER